MILRLTQNLFQMLSLRRKEAISKFGVLLKYVSPRITTNLRNYLELELNSIYEDALGFVKIKTQNSVDFPLECPYTLSQLLDIHWLSI